MRHSAAWVLAGLVAAACGDDGATGGGSATDDTDSSGATTATGTGTGTGIDPLACVGEHVALPPLDAPVLTTDKTLVLAHAIEDDEVLDPRVPEQLDQLLADGYGDVDEGPGEPVIARTLDGADPPEPGANPTLLTRFVHLADAQLVDDESPARVVNLDGNGPTNGAFRAHEANLCAMLNATNRTINALHAETPLDFVLLGGDNIDNAQLNELQWFLSIMTGDSAVQCDSGIDDDPEPDNDADPKDCFHPVGLDPSVPWLWVTGNHDILFQGNFPPETQKGVATGTLAELGARDWSMPGGPVVTEVEADANRRQLDRDELHEILMAHGDGHGIDADVLELGKAYYTFDVGDALRFVVIDTAAETGSADGLVRQGDLDNLLRPALDEAAMDGMLTIVTSHHGSGSLTDGSGFGGDAQADAVTVEEFEGLLGEYDNVLMQLAGHSHVHSASPIMPAGGSAYWQVKTSAISDHPHQIRVLEIHDQDNGYVSIRSIAIDYADADDPPAADGRARGAADVTSAWSYSGLGEIDERNVELWIPTP